MLDGMPLIDAHQHPVRLSTVKPAWMGWAEQFGQPGWRAAYTADGEIIPRAFGDLMRAEGVDHALVICEYSPKATGTQPAEDLLSLTAHDPGRFSLVATSTRICTTRSTPNWHGSSPWARSRSRCTRCTAASAPPARPSTPPTRPA